MGVASSSTISRLVSYRCCCTTPGDRDELLEGLLGELEAGLLKAQIKEGLSNYLYEQTRRRPLVFPVVVEV